MFPIILDLKKLNILVVGDGPATERRLKLLKDAGCEPKIIKYMPQEDDFRNINTVMIGDFDEQTTAEIYTMAKKAGALVNAEDMRKYCDFHVPAIVRRGDLLLTVSTNAASPRLARRLKQFLEKLFLSDWAKIVEEIKIKRLSWKKQGMSFEEVGKNTDKILESGGWIEKLECRYKK